MCILYLQWIYHPRSLLNTVLWLFLFCGSGWTEYAYSLVYYVTYRMSEKSGTGGNFIYYLHYLLCMFTPTLYAFSQPLYNVCGDFAQHIGIDSSTTVSNSLPKVTKISDFDSIHLCLQEFPKCKVPTLSSNVTAIFSLLTFNFNL
jgi:hypothetical protein